MPEQKLSRSAEKAAIQVTGCPFCGAAPKRACRSRVNGPNGGVKTRHPHKRRMEAWRLKRQAQQQAVPGEGGH